MHAKHPWPLRLLAVTHLSLTCDFIDTPSILQTVFAFIRTNLPSLRWLSLRPGPNLRINALSSFALVAFCEERRLHYDADCLSSPFVPMQDIFMEKDPWGPAEEAVKVVVGALERTIDFVATRVGRLGVEYEERKARELVELLRPVEEARLAWLD